jgi:hypothetical protein
VSGSIQFVSIIKLSEEAGLQFFGSDFIAIQKVRCGSITFALFISILLKENSSSFEHLFDATNKEPEVYLVILIFINFHVAQMSSLNTERQTKFVCCK